MFVFFNIHIPNNLIQIHVQSNLNEMVFILPLYEWVVYWIHLVRPSVWKICVALLSAGVHRNDLIFGLKLYLGELYRVSPFQVFWSSTSCLPILWNFSIPDYYMKICVTIFSAFFHRNDLIFGLKLYLGELYHISSFQVCRPSTSCLLLLWNFSIPDYYMKISVRIFSAFVHRNDLIFSLQLYFWELYYVSPFQVCWPSTSCLLILCIFSILILLAHLVCDSQI